MAVTINGYNKRIEYAGDGAIDLDDDTFKLELYNISHVFTATHTQRSDISANAEATANGYTNPGQNMTVTWTESSGTVTWDATDVSWTASGGSITATDGVIYSDTATSPVDALLYSIDFDGLQTANDGTAFLVTWHASGIFTIS